MRNGQQNFEGPTNVNQNLEELQDKCKYAQLLGDTNSGCNGFLDKKQLPALDKVLAILGNK